MGFPSRCSLSPSRFFLSHACFFLCPLLPSACYAGYIFADHCNSQPVISAGFCSLLSFVSSFSSFDLALVFIGLYQSCLDYGFVCWILNWLVCCLNNDVNSSIACSADSRCGFSRLLQGQKKQQINLQHPAVRLNYLHNTIFCSGCWGVPQDL